VETTQGVLDSKAFIDDAMHKYFKGEGVVHGIWYDTNLVGCIGVNDINQAHRKAALGYWLDQAYQDRGIMTRAARQMITFAFRDLKINRMEILCALRNYRAGVWLSGWGFQQEGILREYYWQNGHYVDMLIFSMLRKDWKEN
jgi:ribosomal-protein-serine acetyltransferase